MNAKPLVLFDVGAVLARINFYNMGRKAQELSRGRISPDEFLRKYSETGIEKNYLLGKISTSEFLQGLEEIIGNDINEDELRRLAVSNLNGIIDDMLGLKHGLIAKGNQVGIFSNTTELHYLKMLREFPEIYANANPLILSFQRHLVKPDTDMYQLVNHSNVIYIDDSQTYVNKGMEFSWKGIVYLGSVDSSEPQRKRDEKPILKNDSLRIAYSAKNVKKYLREFGVD